MSLLKWFSSIKDSGSAELNPYAFTDKDKHFKSAVVSFLKFVALYHETRDYDEQRLIYYDAKREFTRMLEVFPRPDAPLKTRSQYSTIKNECRELMTNLQLDYERVQRQRELYRNRATVKRELSTIFEADEKRRATMRAR